MNWFRRYVGLDFIDVLIQFGVTVAVMASFDMSGAPEAVLAMMAGLSIGILGVRRHFALKRQASDPAGLTSGQMAAARLEEIEFRLAELEAGQAAMIELENRLDFAERMLARPEDRPLLERKSP